jgi:hypothetical protein
MCWQIKVLFLEKDGRPKTEDGSFCFKLIVAVCPMTDDRCWMLGSGEWEVGSPKLSNEFQISNNEVMSIA